MYVLCVTILPFRGLLAQAVGELLTKLRDLRADHHRAIGLAWIALIIRVMVLLGRPESLQGLYGGHDRLIENRFLCELLDHLRRGCCLRVCCSEDR